MDLRLDEHLQTLAVSLLKRKLLEQLPTDDGRLWMGSPGDGRSDSIKHGHKLSSLRGSSASAQVFLTTAPLAVFFKCLGAAAAP